MAYLKQKMLETWQTIKTWDYSFYVTAAAAAVTPVVLGVTSAEQAQALKNLVGAVGSSLLANKFQQLKDKKDLLETLKRDLPKDEGLREVLDELLEKLAVFPSLLEEMAEKERAAFRNDLREELKTLGNWERFKTVLESAHMSKQASAGAILNEGPVKNSILNTGDLNTGDLKINIHAPADPDAGKKKA